MRAASSPVQKLPIDRPTAAELAKARYELEHGSEADRVWLRNFDRAYGRPSCAVCRPGRIERSEQKKVHYYEPEKEGEKPREPRYECEVSFYCLDCNKLVAAVTIRSTVPTLISDGDLVNAEGAWLLRLRQSLEKDQEKRAKLVRDPSGPDR